MDLLGSFLFAHCKQEFFFLLIVKRIKDCKSFSMFINVSLQNKLGNKAKKLKN